MSRLEQEFKNIELYLVVNFSLVYKVGTRHSIEFDVFSTVHHSIELFHQPILMHNFLYSLTICLLHYYPRHVSSINMPIFRRKNCIHTASGIFALCKRLHSTLVESRLQSSTCKYVSEKFSDSGKYEILTEVKLGNLTFL